MLEHTTILLVDDDDDLRSAMEFLLQRAGYRVVATGDGLEAVELAVKHQPQIALVDLLIPGQSGFQVTYALRERFGDAIRIAIVSGSLSDAHCDYATVSGAEHFLGKPFTTSQLLELVANLCATPANEQIAKIAS